MFSFLFGSSAPKKLAADKTNWYRVKYVSPIGRGDPRYNTEVGQVDIITGVVQFGWAKLTRIYFDLYKALFTKAGGPRDVSYTRAMNRVMDAMLDCYLRYVASSQAHGDALVVTRNVSPNGGFEQSQQAYALNNMYDPMSNSANSSVIVGHPLDERALHGINELLHALEGPARGRIAELFGITPSGARAAASGEPMVDPRIAGRYLLIAGNVDPIFFQPLNPNVSTLKIMFETTRRATGDIEAAVRGAAAAAAGGAGAAAAGDVAAVGALLAAAPAAGVNPMEAAVGACTLAAANLYAQNRRASEIKQRFERAAALRGRTREGILGKLVSLSVGIGATILGVIAAAPELRGGMEAALRAAYAEAAAAGAPPAAALGVAANADAAANGVAAGVQIEAIAGAGALGLAAAAAVAEGEGVAGVAAAPQPAAAGGGGAAAAAAAGMVAAAVAQEAAGEGAAGVLAQAAAEGGAGSGGYRRKGRKTQSRKSRKTRKGSRKH